MTSTHDLLHRFYIPALQRSVQYDRGVGYFTSAWLRLAATGLAALAANGGHARIVASPKLDKDDWAALRQGADAQSNQALQQALQRPLDELERDLRYDTLAALAWMIADGLLDFRVAIPTGDLDGDFHDKFGVFRDLSGDVVAFHGSPNDSERAFRNYESISIYYSWIDQRELLRAQGQQDRFNLIWSNGDANLRVYDLPEATRRNLAQFTERFERPYKKPDADPPVDHWRHQKEALAEFLKHRHGILEMATGTGKTRTALSILNELHQRGQIKGAVITASGTDLLDQWYRELGKHSPFRVYRAYESNRETLKYLNDPENGLLLISRQFLSDVIDKLSPAVVANALLVCDEVHGLGSPALVRSFAGRLKPFKYRLGLSATPEREYDDEGNLFIEDEIGPVIYQFGLKEAIQRGILCELDYVGLEYAFSDEDRAGVRRAIAAYHAKEKAGEAPSKEVLYQEIARIRKLSQNKLPPFKVYLHQHPEILHRCLIFVETAEYGQLVQNLILEISGRYHTYYGGDDRINLVRFARNELDCLLTCHRISEGIDIQSVNNVVLFSSARARLETIQRLGRCLRIDATNPDKRAVVVDFIRTDDVDNSDPLADPTVDIGRRDWFRDLAVTRRVTD